MVSPKKTGPDSKDRTKNNNEGRRELSEGSNSNSAEEKHRK